MYIEESWSKIKCHAAKFIHFTYINLNLVSIFILKKKIVGSGLNKNLNVVGL